MSSLPLSLPFPVCSYQPHSLVLRCGRRLRSLGQITLVLHTSSDNETVTREDSMMTGQLQGLVTFCLTSFLSFSNAQSFCFISLIIQYFNQYVLARVSLVMCMYVTSTLSIFLCLKSYFLLFFTWNYSGNRGNSEPGSFQSTF